MRNFYLALIRLRDHIALIIAVILSFLLILTNDSREISIIRGKSNDFFAFFYKPVAWFRSMAIVEEEAALLREKNIQLELQNAAIIELATENERLRQLLEYRRASKLTLLPAQVINKGISSGMSTITIDVGAMDSVKKNCPVLTPNGVIGKTAFVGEKNTLVQLISDRNFRLSVQILPSGAKGILRWLLGDECEIREIQRNSIINVGDYVVTSGFSDIFPKDLPVGRVTATRDERGSFNKIVRVKIDENLGSLINVFVITNQSDEH